MDDELLFSGGLRISAMTFVWSCREEKVGESGERENLPMMKRLLWMM